MTAKGSEDWSAGREKDLATGAEGEAVGVPIGPAGRRWIGGRERGGWEWEESWRGCVESERAESRNEWQSWRSQGPPKVLRLRKRSSSVVGSREGAGGAAEDWPGEVGGGGGLDKLRGRGEDRRGGLEEESQGVKRVLKCG